MQQNRSTFYVFVTAAFIILSLLFVLWFSSRSSGRRPDIVVPGGDAPIVGENLTPALLNDPATYLSYSLTNENVLAQIRTLRQPENYRLTLSATLYGRTDSVTTRIQLAHTPSRDYYAHTANGRTDTYLATSDALYGWSEGATPYRTFSPGDFPDEVLSRLPDMTSLALGEQEQVTGTEYVRLGDTWTISLRIAFADGTSAAYFVAIDSGLVLQYERYIENTLLFSVYILSQDFDVPDPALFTLPDGTVLS